MKIGQLMAGVHLATGLKDNDLQGATLKTAAALAFSNGEGRKGRSLKWLASKRRTFEGIINNGNLPAYRRQNTI